MGNRNRTGAAIVAGAMLLACGGPSAPTATEVQVFTRPVAPLGGAEAAAMTMGPRDALVEISTDWTLAGNDIDVYATPGDCIDVPSALTAASCLKVAEAAGSSAKPERLSFTGTAGRTFKVFVVNRGSQADTVTVRVTLR